MMIASGVLLVSGLAAGDSGTSIASRFSMLTPSPPIKSFEANAVVYAATVRFHFLCNFNNLTYFNPNHSLPRGQKPSRKAQEFVMPFSASSSCL